MQNKWEHNAKKLEQNFIDLKIDGRIDMLLMHYCDYKYKEHRDIGTAYLLEYLFSEFYPIFEGSNWSQDYDLLRETLGIMIEENLITSESTPAGMIYLPTAKGHRINEAGGWLKHIEDEKGKEKLIKEQIQSTITTNQLIKITTIFQIILLVITIAVSGLSAWYTKEEVGYQKQELDIHKQELLKGETEYKTKYQDLHKAFYLISARQDSIEAKIKRIQKPQNLGKK